MVFWAQICIDKYDLGEISEKHFYTGGHIGFNMLSKNSTGSCICLVYVYFFHKIEAGYAYKRYAYKKKHVAWKNYDDIS